MLEIDEEISRAATAYLPALIDEKKLRCWLLNVFCSLQAKCPNCGEMLTDKAKQSFLQLRRTSCKSCGKTISFDQGTLLANSRLSHAQFVCLAALAPVIAYQDKVYGLMGVSQNSRVSICQPGDPQ